MPEQKKPEENLEERPDSGKNGYRFLDQTIKKRPVSHRPAAIRILSVLFSGVMIGLIASLVFTLTQPGLRTSSLAGNTTGEVTIAPADFEAEPEDGEGMEAESVDADSVSEKSAAEEQVPEQPGYEEVHVEETVSEKPAAGNTVSEQNSTVAAIPEEEIPEEDLSVVNASDEMTETVTEGAAADPVPEMYEEEVQEPAAQEAAAAERSESVSTESSGTEQAGSVSAESAAGNGSDVEDEAEDAPDQTDTEAAGEEKQEEDTGISLQEYRQLYKDMLAVAEEPEHALVQVIGITSELDYFNRNYENQRRLSGLIVAETETMLFILTEYRAVDQVERIQVVFCDGSMTDAVFQKADPSTGLAVVKVPLDNIRKETREELSVAPLGNSYLVSRGEPVLALGSPLGFSDSIAFGIVTSTEGKAPVADTEYALLTTDIDGSPEGSGVLIDLDGKVIGIITPSFSSGTECITCLAVSRIRKLIEDLSNNEKQIYAGILSQEVTQDITDRTGIPRGLLVTAVELDSPAMLAGIKEYDVLVRIGDKTVETLSEYQKVLQELEPDEAVEFTAMRRGAEGFAEMVFEVTIESR